jgi:hypothetical protein
MFFITGADGQLRKQHSARKRKYPYQGTLFDFGFLLSCRTSFSGPAEKQNKQKNTLEFCHKSVAFAYSEAKEKVKCHVYHQVLD